MGSPVQIRPSRLVVELFRTYLCPHQSQQKSHSIVKWPLPEAHAHPVPRPPTRAFVNTAEPAKPAVKGSKIAKPPRTLHSDPSSCEPADTIPNVPAHHRKPDAHRADMINPAGELLE